jgi:hypothetical protein
MKSMGEEMESKFQQILAKIDIKKSSNESLFILKEGKKQDVIKSLSLLDGFLMIILACRCRKCSVFDCKPIHIY